jgi:flagellar basal-body rod protein FlgC
MSLLSSLSVSASGLEAQRARAEVLAENIANSDTTRTPEGGPYRRKSVVFETAPATTSFASVFSSEIANTSQGVRVSEVRIDDSAPEKRYMPGHPDADKDGYVSLPKSNPAEDMVDLMSTSRSYEANVSAMSAMKDMISRSIDIFKQ